ncbi:MAG: hypothetical protein NTW95_08625 [Candidatus Aminicenantes bacterium]|nr:hypothetical protein [Candidatus Aminicenantes bacterium]
MAAESGEDRRGISSRLRFLLFFFLILAAISALLHVEKFRRLQDIDRGREKLAALVRARPVEHTMARRARFYRVQYCLGYPEAASLAVADLSRRLCVVFGPARIIGLQIDPSLRDLRFELVIGIQEEPGLPGAGKALETFAGLYMELGDFADLSDLSFIKNDPTDGGLNVFTVTGQAELP